MTAAACCTAHLLPARRHPTAQIFSYERDGPGDVGSGYPSDAAYAGTISAESSYVVRSPLCRSPKWQMTRQRPVGKIAAGSAWVTTTKFTTGASAWRSRRLNSELQSRPPATTPALWKRIQMAEGADAVLRGASWNINHVTKRRDLLLDWLERTRPDVVALQELKTPTADFPVAASRNVGYEPLVVGQGMWNGVALLARDMSHVLPPRRCSVIRKIGRHASAKRPSTASSSAAYTFPTVTRNLAQSSDHCVLRRAE